MFPVSNEEIERCNATLTTIIDYINQNPMIDGKEMIESDWLALLRQLAVLENTAEYAAVVLRNCRQPSIAAHARLRQDRHIFPK